MKKLISLLLILLLVVTSFAIVAAEAEPETESAVNATEITEKGPSNTEAAADEENDTPNTTGQCGDHLKWEYFAGINALELSGSGDMYDFSSSEPAPWVNFREEIKTVRLLGGNDQEAITSIGNFAFANCLNLEKVIMVGGKKEIQRVGTCAFYTCMSLSDVDYTLSNALADDATFGTRAFAFSGLTSFCLPPETTKISTGMFSDCSSLESIYGCDNVTDIGEDAFSRCISLKSFDVPAGVTEIKDRTFVLCTNLESVRTETSNLVSIGESAFQGCVSLKRFYMPESLTSISKCAFSGAQGLEEVLINRYIAVIPESAFDGCISLQSIHIPFNVQTIGKKAFANCTNLTNVCLEDGVKILRENAFSNSGITAMFLPTTITTVESNVFSGTPLSSLCVFSNQCDIAKDFCEQDESLDLIVWGVAGSNVQEDLSTCNITTGTMGPLANDISKNAYYYLPANYICFRGFEGWEDTSLFQPAAPMTRAMMVTMLWKIEGSPIVEQSPNFADVPEDAYYKQAVDWAYKVHVTCGTGAASFSPTQTISREQAVTMLFRYAEYKQLDTSARASLEKYADRKYIAPYAKVAFQWAVANGIIAGTSKTRLSPKHKNLRSEAVTIMYRFLYAIKNANE